MQPTYTRPPKGQGGVYLIRLSDQHYYGGSTQSFQWRWAEHLRSLKKGTHKNPHMQAVFNQHQRFEPVFLEVIADRGARLLAEQVWLDEHFGASGCVNICPQAEAAPMAGRKHTEESRRKMAEAKRGRKLSDAHRASLSQAQRRRHAENPVTDETRQRISDALKGRKLPHVSERNRARTGWKHSDEAKAKISAANRKRHK